MKRLLITGSRGWRDRALIEERLRAARAHLGGTAVLVHGDCRGTDRIAADIWQSWGLPTEAHPADWHTHGTKAGPIRNAHMVKLGADLCLAFMCAGESVGTRHCVGLAVKAGIPVWREQVDELGRRLLQPPPGDFRVR